MYYSPEYYKNEVLLVFFKDKGVLEYCISYYSRNNNQIKIFSIKEDTDLSYYQKLSAYSFELDAQVALDLRNKRDARALNNNEKDQDQLIAGHTAVVNITKEIIKFISKLIADKYESLLPIQQNKAIVDNTTKNIDYIVNSLVNSTVASVCARLHINGKYNLNYLYYLSSVDINNKGSEYQQDLAAIMQFSNIRTQDFIKEFKRSIRVLSN